MSEDLPKELLIYCPLPSGGIAEHAHYQARAATELGVSVTLLSSPGFLNDGRLKPYHLRECLFAPNSSNPNSVVRKIYLALALIANEWRFAYEVLRSRSSYVLLGASSDMLALLTVWPHLLLSRLYVTYAANIHDPRRKQIGRSALLHRLSVRMSFAPVSIGVLHEDTDDNQPDIPYHIRRVRVPYGRYDMDLTGADGRRIRSTVAPAGSQRYVFLSFGYIADRKNIDLFIRALVERPNAALIVAGPAASSRDRPASYYLDLANSLGVANRVRIDAGFVSFDRVKDYFDACDAILLSYNGAFQSQSGVLLVAANWSKPILASSASGPLSETIERFGLGVVVEPDSAQAIVSGIDVLAGATFDSAGWNNFRAHATWNRNMRLILEAFRKSVESAPQDELAPKGCANE